MGHHPKSAEWDRLSGNGKPAQSTLSGAQCKFINENVGVSRRTLRDVCELFNSEFETHISYEEFMALRADAIADGRCRTTYFRNYFKGENSSERELRQQTPVLKARITGGCQYKSDIMKTACGNTTQGRFCEIHARTGYKRNAGTLRGRDYIDSTLGKYG